MGIEENRYSHLNQMSPVKYEKIGNKKEKVAVFYETAKDNIDFVELHKVFIDTAEEIMSLGLF